MPSVAIAGASGYVGGELMRLIANHPQLQLRTITANSNVGETVAALHPGLQSFQQMTFSETNSQNLSGHDVVFLALPHTKSAQLAAELESAKLIIDCGADFRLSDAKSWRQYYGTEHAGSWPYGLPELTLAAGGKLRGKLRGATRIAVPGCNVSAISLALAPALTAGLIEPLDIVAVLSVGTSGAGRSKAIELSASEVLGSARAYGAFGTHRHTPEIEQNLSWAAGQSVRVSFTPVLVPMSRGILAVASAAMAKNSSLAKLQEVYHDAYHDESFVDLLPPGELPTTASVRGSNLARLAIGVDSNSGRLSAICAIDNLVKGTAGAAIQSMNLALGFAEQSGLLTDGLHP